MDKIEFKNGSVIQSKKIQSSSRGNRKYKRIKYIFSQEKNSYLVTYRYKNKLHLYNEKQKWEYDNFVIKATDNKSVHKYLNNFRQEFIDCGYEMEYEFEKIGEGNFVEIQFNKLTK